MERYLIYTLFFLCLGSPGSIGIPTAQAQIPAAPDAPKPLSPEESASRMKLPPGFRIELVASEPLVTEPSCIAWDEWGRLFVSELHGYNIEGHIDTQALNASGVLDKEVRRIRWELQGGEVAERAAAQQYGVIKLLRDRDGDGRMDETIVWADDLPPCYGIVPARGGLLVTCAPHIVFLADRDGDDHPEVREILYTGFNLRVLERGINNPRWGFDDWIYVGSGGDGGTITGPYLHKPVELGGNDFRIRADGSAIEAVQGRVGTFGLTLNDIGDRFPSSGGRPALYALPLPYHYLQRNPHVASPGTNHTAAPYDRGYRISEPHPWRVRRAEDPAWVKFYGEHETTSIYFSGGCSTTFYGDTLFPAPYQGNLFYCEPSLNIVHRTLLRRDGVGYRAERAPEEATSEFLASTDQWFRPMNLRVGPHGALTIVDMYREIIEDYSAIPRFLQQQYGLDQGKAHGRIWRLLPEKAPALSPPNLASLKGSQLVPLLAHANPWHRETAQRLLVERRESETAPAIRRLAVSGSTSHTGVLHALYTLSALEALSEATLHEALTHSHYGVRMHALRLSEDSLNGTGAEPLHRRLHELASDPDPRLRLQLALTLGESRQPGMVPTWLSLATQFGNDRWMASALLSSANHSSSKSLLLGLISSSTRTETPTSLLEPLARTVTSRGDLDVLKEILRNLPNASESQQKLILSGFRDGLPELSPHDWSLLDGWDALLAPWLTQSPGPLRSLSLEMATRLGLTHTPAFQPYIAGATEDIQDDAKELEVRLAALELLSRGPHASFAPLAEQLLAPQHPPALREAVIEALATSKETEAGRLLVTHWPVLSPGDRKRMMEGLLAQERHHGLLMEALLSGTLPASAVSEIAREKLLKSRDPKLRKGATKAFSQSTASSQSTPTNFPPYIEALTKPRNLEHGRQVFLDACALCHQLGDVGNAIGPSLTSLTNRPDEAVLIDILDPASKVDPEYALYIVTTKEGESAAGILTAESATSVTIGMANGETRTLLRKEIVSMSASQVSLMPANLGETLSPQQMADLLAYLRKTLSDKRETAP